MRVLSLFDGISCGHLALDRAGIPVDIYISSEIDKTAMAITQRNYPNTVQVGDVTKVDGTAFGEIDLLLAGSPCQGLSLAGIRLGLGDDRSKLFFEFVRVLEECKPKYWLLENTRMSKDNQAIITGMLGTEPVLIDSALLSAQHRKRLYWTNIPNIQKPKDKGLLLKDILQSTALEKYDITERYYKKRLGTLAYSKSRDNLRYPHQKSKTLMTGGHGISNSGSTNLCIEGVGIRIPTPVECERLQTIPDNYTDIGILDSARYHAVGNAWTVDVIAHILSGIRGGDVQSSKGA